MQASSSPRDKNLCDLDLRCPPLPRTLLEAMELMQKSGGPELDEAIELVQHDPVAVARLLRIVNSAFYGQRGQVTSIQRAVLVIGASQTVGLVMSMSLVEIRSALDSRTAAPFLNLVRHSIATGFLAQHIIEKDPALPMSSPDKKERMSEAFTAGIIHDFGKIVLLYNFPEQAGLLYSGEVADAHSLLEIERDVFGYDHIQTGLYLAERVNFPDALVRTIARHTDYSDLNGTTVHARRLVYAVALANQLTHAIGYALVYEHTPEEVGRSEAANLLLSEGLVGYPSTSALIKSLVDARPEMSRYVDAVI